MTGRQIAVIALLEVDAQFAGDFILHLIQCALGFRNDRAVAAGIALLILLSTGILLLIGVILILIHKKKTPFTS